MSVGAKAAPPCGMACPCHGVVVLASTCRTLPATAHVQAVVTRQASILDLWHFYGCRSLPPGRAEALAMASHKAVYSPRPPSPARAPLTSCWSLSKDRESGSLHRGLCQAPGHGAYTIYGNIFVPASRDLLPWQLLEESKRRVANSTQFGTALHY